MKLQDSFTPNNSGKETKANDLAKNNELSPNFTFKVIMGFIFLFFTIYFIYLLVRILTQ